METTTLPLGAAHPRQVVGEEAEDRSAGRLLQAAMDAQGVESEQEKTEVEGSRCHLYLQLSPELVALVLEAHSDSARSSYQ